MRAANHSFRVPVMCLAIVVDSFLRVSIPFAIAHVDTASAIYLATDIEAV